MSLEGKKRHFRWHYRFLENVTFLRPCRITKHYKNRASADTRENPKWHVWFEKVCFGKGPRKGVFTIRDTQKLCSAENSVYSVFSSKTQLFRYKRVQFDKKNRNLPKIGGGLLSKKRCLFVVLFFCLCFCSFLENAQTRLFSCNFRGFSSSVPLKAPLWNPSLLPNLLFCLVSFCLNSIFCFLSINPFEKLFWGFLVSFLVFAFTSVNVCFFLGNKLS